LSWLTRTELADRHEPDSASTGLLLGALPAEGFVSLTPDERRAASERTATTLAAAGLAIGDRAVISLNSDGDLAGASFAEALGELGAAGAVVGPRGRMRLLAAIRRLRPNVWITTPTGALDFLARLYLEFNIDPMELDLEKIFLVGEIGSPGSERRLADEFESEVTGVYCDPLFGVALAHGDRGGWKLSDPGVLGLAALERDEWLERDVSSPVDAPVELALRAKWSATLCDQTIRMGQVVGPGSSDGLFRHTVGDHLLVRGRWLSLPLLRRALSRIDGIAGWRVTVSRGDGTLDKLTVSLAFERASLVENPMWAARAREAITGMTPIAFELETELASEGAAAETIIDERGHHLGPDRATAAARAEGEAP